MVTENLGEVESVCPECLGRITGRLIRNGDCVRMEKKCRQHGAFSTVLWRGVPSFTSWYRPKRPFLGNNRLAQDQGCPFDCGLCAGHGQRTCTALVEITPRCNLHCPVCFADSGVGGPEPDLPPLVRMFDDIRAQSGDCNLQLSGGEPTLRSDLPEIIRSAKTAGFTFIQVNSNGLVPTLVPGVNTDQIWQIVRFGLQRQPQVRGVHFQPISYFGRFPTDFVPIHITLPEIMQTLEGQSLGQVKAEDFRPPACEHALCSFSAKYLVEEGYLIRLGGSPCDCTSIPAEEGARLAIAGTARRWAGIPVCTPPPAREKTDELDRFLQHAVAGSPLYRRRLADIDIHSLQSLPDLAALPLMRSCDILDNGPRLLAVSQSRIARIVTMQTSGSTGPAKRLWFTAADLAATLEFFLAGMRSLVSTKDRVLVLLPFSTAESVGDLLLRALRGGGIRASGHWPPDGESAGIIGRDRPTCLVGLPQHLLSLAEAIGPGPVQSMLLCSDYAAPALRRRIEAACDCRTFLHYGATETGLGGAVECAVHNGCHLRESDLLVEIIYPHSGRPLADGALGEIVVTTLGREAMPLIRYRTGDSARLERSPCPCGGITARLIDIRGRLDGCPLPNGNKLYSQDLDDHLYTIPGLLDYRIIVDGEEPERLHAEILATSAGTVIVEHFRQKILLIPAIRDSVATGRLLLGTILDLRSTGERYAACSR